MAERSNNTEEADSLGGCEECGWEEYEKREEEPSFNKKDHFERSANNQPNHLKVAKKKLPFNVSRKISS